jgi:hypothetical protein
MTGTKWVAPGTGHTWQTLRAAWPHEPCNVPADQLNESTNLKLTGLPLTEYDRRRYVMAMRDRPVSNDNENRIKG